ncbi:molybdopterin molybdenumtransferase MoeA [Acinetobacter sp. LoGeW2-3]|uniref:molybdopterin molybdotransferase MoeA n=1 Tax=Acinetobacter sp. LoGeW2-3 TaxID=1808001 RepID=UPI000C05A06C|nr:molybdopterin molybdotransferase MoeA [Acinetobacter sp. LoGeW2-3]ATO20486.1 molybdopterin molybdenumtransferase MoeA [Acinetobacter sp. LoGeW2-3]
MNHAVTASVHSACGSELGLISVDQALQMILDHTDHLGTETLPLSQALNRFVAEDIYSDIQLPLFSQSAVDGYAICMDTDMPSGSTFELIGEIRAGQVADLELQPGQAVRIFTGAKIPKQTTTVTRQEIVQLHGSSITLTEALRLDADIRKAGEEIAIGQCLVSRGQQLSVGTIAALSMAGVHEVSVYRYPKIAVVITGDEVAETVEDLNSGKIFDANAPLIQAWFQSRNQQVDILHVADTEQAVSDLFTNLRDQYDLILTTGGVSVGDYDFVRPVALKLGFEQIFWKVKQKPGKPMFFAKSERSEQGTCYLLGLPGNPGAVYVGMQIYVSTLIDALQGKKLLPPWFSGVISHDLKADSRERLLRMIASFEAGILKLSSLPKQQSHMLSNLMQANCLVRIPANQNIQLGQVLQGLFI